MANEIKEQYPTIKVFKVENGGGVEETRNTINEILGI